MDDTKKVILYPKAASDSKRKRYMLELLPDKNKLAIQTKEPLRKNQDILGSIHDSDFTICYLQPLPQSSTIVQRNYEIRKMIIDTSRYHKMVNIFI